MQTATLQKNASEPPILSPAYIKKVQKLMQAICTNKIKELQDLSQEDKQSLLRGLQDVLEGRVTKA